MPELSVPENAPEVTTAPDDRAGILDSFLANFSEAEAASEAAEVAEVEPTPAVVKPPEAIVDEATEPEARGYRRLLSRETAFRTEKAAWETAKAAHEVELKGFQDVKGKLKGGPSAALAYLRAAGLSQAEIMAVAKKAHYEDLGDLAPPEIRTLGQAEKYAEEARAHREAMEAKLAERDAEQLTSKQQADMAAYQQAAFQHVQGALDTHPRIARFITSGRSSEVSAALMTEAQTIAADMDPNGPPPTFTDVAKSLEARLDALVSALTATTPPEVVAPANPHVAAPKPVLRNAATSAQPTPAPNPEPKSYAEDVEQIRKQAFAKFGLHR